MNRILVIGATGTVGAHVVGELREAGHRPRTFVRDLERAHELLGGDLDHRVGDLTDAGSLRAALVDVDAVFLACANRPDQVELETRVIDLAAAAGVRHVVKLSALGAAVGSPVAFWHWHGLIEEHLLDSGMPATILRPAFAMANLLGAAGQVAEGALFLPAAGARVSMVDPRDVAAAAAAALTGPIPAWPVVHVLTGPDALTFEEVAEDLSDAAGRPVAFVDVPDHAAYDAMVVSGLPEFAASQVVAVFGALRSGLQDTPTQAVRAVTGLQPRSLAEFLQGYAAAFRPVLAAR